MRKQFLVQHQEQQHTESTTLTTATNFTTIKYAQKNIIPSTHNHLLSNCAKINLTHSQRYTDNTEIYKKHFYTFKDWKNYIHEDQNKMFPKRAKGKLEKVWN